MRAVAPGAATTLEEDALAVPVIAPAGSLDAVLVGAGAITAALTGSPERSAVTLGAAHASATEFREDLVAICHGPPDQIIRDGR